MKHINAIYGIIIQILTQKNHQNTITGNLFNNKLFFPLWQKTSDTLKIAIEKNSYYYL